MKSAMKYLCFFYDQSQKSEVHSDFPEYSICTLFSGLDEPKKGTPFDMTDFKASLVAYEVQKSFANKLFSNKTVAKSLIDDTSARLLDNLYLLLKVFVSTKFYFRMILSLYDP